MDQRGISKEITELVLEYRNYIKDRVILNSRSLKKLIKKFLLKLNQNF